MDSREILDKAMKELIEYVDLVKTGEYKSDYIVDKIDTWTKSVLAISKDVDNELKGKPYGSN